MKLQSTDTVLITGASGGLGVHIVQAFAQRGVRLALVAYPGNELADLRVEVEKQGCECISVVSDLRDRNEQKKMLETVLKRFGRVDVLVNNAGIEYTAFYHELDPQEILDVVNVNLEVPMLLTRMLVPQMLERRRGHVVNISSLAGKSGPAFQESYSASKAGLIAFTTALRTTYKNTGFSASVIVPGFIEAGIYARLKASAGQAAPKLLGSLPPQSVARAVLRAIEGDRMEVIVNQWPVRPLLAFSAMCPEAGQWLTDKIGANDFFRRVVEAERKKRAG